MYLVLYEQVLIGGWTSHPLGGSGGMPTRQDFKKNV